MKRKMWERVIVFILVVLVTVPSFVFAAPKVPERKGTVSGAGTDKDPYKLVLGEPIIDIYYKEQKNTQKVYFEFDSSKVSNAANYIVEHNPDKGRLRFKLQASDPNSRDIMVTSEARERYVQAGAINPVKLEVVSGDSATSTGGGGDVEYTNDVQSPYYEIRSIEKMTIDGQTWYHDISLGNGYLMVDNLYAANVSTYSTAYVFAKHRMSASEAYKGVTQQQIKDKMRIALKPSPESNYFSTVQAIFTSPTTLKFIEYDEYGTETEGEEQTISNVETVYVFNGTNSSIHHGEGQEDSWVSKVVAKILTSIGDVFTSITMMGVNAATPQEGGKEGRTVLTIDALVFNEYPYTYINFFDGKADNGGTSMNSIAKRIINKWYDVFKTWALIVYVIILIYVGIRAVFYAGTADQKKVTGLLEGWVMGLLLMFICPVFFKYALMLNDALVDIMRTNSKHSIYAYYSFMEYEGYEEGQDSESYDVNILMGALKDAKKELQTVQNLQDMYQEDMQRAQEALTNSQKNRDEAKLSALEALDSERDQLLDNPNASFTYDGNKISYDDMVEDLWQIVGNYYNNNKDSIDWSDVAGEIGGNFYFDSQFTEELGYLISNYLSHIDVTGSTTDWKNKEALRQGLFDAVMKPEATPIVSTEDSLTVLGYHRDSILLYYATEADIDRINYELDELAKKKANLEAKISNIQNALQMIKNGVSPDMIGSMRKEAADYKLWENIVWFILLFELIILLALYYKRFFVIACLIIIFPLVMIAYVYERSSKPDSSILKNWTEEYIINVFIQTVHSILYVVLVETSYTVYSDVSDNWLLFVLSVLALITSEGVVKHIMGVQGNTVKDLAKYSAEAGRRAAATVAVAKTALGTMNDLENIDNDYKNQLAHDKQSQEKHDEKRDIWRTNQDNKIRSDSSLTEEEKKRKLEELNRKREEKDKKTAKRRAGRAQHRRRMAYARGVGRVVANATGVVATVAAGFAAGGDSEDFIKAAAATKAVLGKGESVALSSDAQKMIDENAKVKSQADVNSIKEESASDGSQQPLTEPVRYGGSGTGNGDGNYQYVPGKLGTASVDDDEIESGAHTRLADAFSQRLTEEQVITARTRQQTIHYREDRSETEEEK